MIFFAIPVAVAVVYLGLLIGFNELMARAKEYPEITTTWFLLLPFIYLHAPIRALIKHHNFTPLKLTLLAPEIVATICLTVVDRSLLEARVYSASHHKKKVETQKFINKNIDKSFDGCLLAAS